MLAEEKEIKVKVGKECWKFLKVLSIQQEVSVGEIAQELLEKCFASSSKRKERVGETQQE